MNDAEQYTQNVACLEACSTLLKYGIDLVGDWRPRGGRSYNMDADVLILSLHARSTRTFQGVIRVSQHGLAEQAAMLSRSLYEDMVDGHWISRNRDRAVDRFKEHDRFSRDLKARVVDQYPDHFDEWDTSELPRLDPAERKRLVGVFGPYGTKSWTGLDLSARVNAILPCWPTDADRRQVRFIYAWVVRHVNETLHTSSASLSGMIRDTENPRAPLAFELGASDEDLPRALFFAYWTYWQLVSLLMDEFTVSGLDELRKIVERDLPVFGRSAEPPG